MVGRSESELKRNGDEAVEKNIDNKSDIDLVGYSDCL